MWRINLFEIFFGFMQASLNFEIGSQSLTIRVDRHISAKLN